MSGIDVERDPDEEEASAEIFLKSADAMADSLESVNTALSRYEGDLHSQEAEKALEQYRDNVKKLEAQMEQYRKLAEALKKDADRLRQIKFGG